MKLGINSLSLAVKNIEASKQFYENLGFTAVPDGGSIGEKWLIMENGSTKIGLFQDMFPNNIITFNPKDARTIHQAVAEANVSIISASKSIEEEESGACNFMIADPDGNQILFDQFE